MIESIGRYRVVRMLGEGGMGRTYLAEVAGPRGFSRRVVLKLVRDEMDPALAQALLDEARLVASLSHRNVCPVLDFHEIDGRRVVILDYVDGLDLGQLLLRRSRLPWPLAAYIGSEIAAALDYAHRRCDSDGRPLGLVHRDVSPANILLSWEGEVKLADFGVARFSRRDGATTSVGGKLVYMPPEQRHGDEIDGRADIYALAVTLYEAVTGINPLAGGARRLPRLADELAPTAMAELLEQASAERRDERPTAARFREVLLDLPTMPRDPAAQLARYLAEVRGDNHRAREALLRAAAGTQRALTYVASKVRPRRARAMLLALAGVALIATVVTTWPHQRAAPPPPKGVVASAPASIAPAAPASPPPEVVAPVPAPVAAPPSVRAQPRSPTRRPSGTLSINATPWAHLFLDGRAIGHTPQIGLRVPVGRHTLRLLTASGESRTRTIEVDAGRESRVAVNFAEP